MFICDCHCDTLTELYKKGTSLYDNDQPVSYTHLTLPTTERV